MSRYSAIVPDRPLIYRTDPHTYDLLISREDHEHHLLHALQEIGNFQNADICDLGAGTGRISCMLAPFVRSILLTDSAQPMLKIAEEKLNKMGFQNARFHTGDLSVIPAPDNAFDYMIAGWSLCSIALCSEQWESAIAIAMKEMQRVLKPGGTIIIIESLGTGQEKPMPPTDRFALYFRLLEGVYHFQSTHIRTDYKFGSPEEKETLLRFFFDAAMLDKGVKNDSVIYPECTGIWWAKLP